MFPLILLGGLAIAAFAFIKQKAPMGIVDGARWQYTFMVQPSASTLQPEAIAALHQSLVGMLGASGHVDSFDVSGDNIVSNVTFTSSTAQAAPVGTVINYPGITMTIVEMQQLNA